MPSGFRCSLCRLFLALALLFLARQSGESQTALSEIVGEVLDPSGQVVARAPVKLTNQATGIQTSLQTNDVGGLIGGYGLFGVVTAVRLHLAPRQKVQRIVQLLELKDVMPSFEKRIADISILRTYSEAEK